MATSSRAESRHQPECPFPEWAEPRTQALRAIAHLLLGSAVALLAAIEFVPDMPVDALWLTMASVVVSGLLTLGLLRWGPTPAGVLLVAVLAATCLGEAVVFASVLPLFALPLVVVVAAATLGHSGGFGVAGLTSLAMLLLPPGGGAGYTKQQVLGPVCLTATAAALVWLGSRPVQAALNWSWDNYAHTQELTEQLRRHRAELAEALTNLNRTCYQLESTSKELARARAAAEEARGLKAQFAANISHELRTPINLIIGFTELMLSTPQAAAEPFPESYRGDLEAICRNAKHLSDLIDDVLELGEIDVGRMGLRKEWARLREIADEAISVVATLLEDKRLSVSAEIPEDLPPLYVDRTRVRQVFINLLNNAARFTDRGGASIKAASDEHDVVVSVADTGVGIGPGDLPHVFEEFRQLEMARQRRAGGTGLGLSICKKLVELHGGNIWAESTPGQGTTFSFTLPLNSNVAGLPMRAPWETWARLPMDQASEEPLVLVVGPDPGPARLFERHLDGFRVVATDNPADVPEETPVQAAIQVLDQSDDLDGALRDATLTTTERPLLLCRMPSERDLRQELQVADYLVKPFTREQLLASLRRLQKRIRTVLVVDDDPNMVDLVTRLLRGSGRRYRVLKAYDGAAALDILQRPDQRVDLLILDLLMPAPDGFAVLGTLRTDPRLASLPVIVVSARGFIDRGVVSSVLAVTREHGLSIRELMACTRALLQTLNPPGANGGAAN